MAASTDVFASALEQAAAVRRREVSSVELTRAHLERIEKINPRLNAYVHLMPELALEQAREADSAEDGLPLRGVPVSIKDLVSVAGHPMTLGSKAFEDFSLPYDAFPVARLKEQGCPILGKTNTSEFGSRPTTRSEEHTSELQSLTDISYAVFCLKKKKHTTLKLYTIEFLQTKTYI